MRHKNFIPKTWINKTPNQIQFRTVAWLAPGWGFGKIEGLRYLKQLYLEFQRLYPRTTFITTGIVHPHYLSTFKVQSKSQCISIQLAQNNSENLGRNIKFLSPTILANLLSLKPEIVISGEFNLWTLLASLFKAIGRWKLVVLWDGISPSIAYSKGGIRSIVRRLIARQTDAFITNTNAAIQYLQNELGVREDHAFRAVYLTSNMKNSLLRDSSNRLTSEQMEIPRFFYVGRLIPSKGLNYLLKAWSYLQRLSSRRPSLWIIGDGSQKDELVKQAQDLNLENVHFVGQVAYSSLAYWYQNCDVFVYPTLEDVWGLAIPEAMELGNPILCSKYAGAHELVSEGENGFIFNPRNPQELTHLMLKFVNSADLIKKFGHKSREIMLSYTSANAAKTFQQVIENIAS